MLKFKHMLLYFILCHILRRISVVLCFDHPALVGTNTSDVPHDEDGKFHTSFDSEFVNLDINARHGYNRFSCICYGNQVTYESDFKFCSIADGRTRIWWNVDKPAYKVVVQFLGPESRLVYVELAKNDPKNIRFFGKEADSVGWKELNEAKYNANFKRFQDELKAHKDNVHKLNDTAVDAFAVFKKNGKISFEVHNYKAEERAVSNSTRKAYHYKHVISQTMYEVNKIKLEGTCGGYIDATEVVFKPECRLVKIHYMAYGVNEKLIWNTLGSLFCTKVVAIGTPDHFTQFVLYMLDNESGRRYVKKVNFKVTPWYQQNEVEQLEPVEVPEFDFGV